MATVDEEEGGGGADVELQTSSAVGNDDGVDESQQQSLEARVDQWDENAEEEWVGDDDDGSDKKDLVAKDGEGR